jgi:hypothetical protein
MFVHYAVQYAGTVAAPTIIANFGRHNYYWPQCLGRNVIVTFNDADLQGFWLSGDRDGFIDYCIAKKKTPAGITPTRPVASRWFNLMQIVSDTSGEFWIHREKEAVWWTVSLPDPVSITLEGPGPGGHGEVYVFQKACAPWSNKNRLGNPLTWSGLHPKAREFLFSEGTFQRLSPENAAYAHALIDGLDLALWHSLPMWKAKADAAKKGAGTSFNALQRTVARMAMTAMGTAANARGQEVVRTVKKKEILFTQVELEQYLHALMKDQEGLCAITGIPLQLDGEYEDDNFLASLDRIDSDGHYEQGNLQLVCRFINRWKNDGRDDEFRRLIAVVRSS